jgi:secernin
MCDVLVALPDSTKQGNIIFGKNSDRPSGECQVIYFSSGEEEKIEKSIRCSYIEVPQSDNVLSTMGCRPYWCWGYETGMNEAGVVGGNAAIFTKSLHDAEAKKDPGLTGMDLLRLGLERGNTAEEAVEIIIELLEKYGQWGSAIGGVSHDKGSYDNSFLLADKSEAWVLETANRHWITERVQNGIRTISNEPSIRKKWDKISPALKDHAKQKKWWYPEKDEFDFAYHIGDHNHYSRQVSHIRWKRANQLLNQYSGSIDNKTVMRVLRDHYEETFLEGPQFHQFIPDFHTICMHDSPAGFTWGNTATSVIVELDPETNTPPLFWLAYLPPCSSVYTAFQFSDSIPDIFKSAGRARLRVSNPTTAVRDEFDEKSLWWRLHRIVTALAGKPKSHYDELRWLFDEIEGKHINRINQLRKAKPKSINNIWIKLLQAIETLEKRWEIN